MSKQADADFQLEWDDCPFTWLALFGLRVIGLRVGPDERALAVEIDGDDAQVVADQLTDQGDAAGEKLLRAVMEGCTVYWLDCDGDCCSESWLADVVGVTALLGERVTETNAVELPEHLRADLDADDKPRTRQEFDQVYGWEIKTRRGVCTLAMRNSSNGYYGGSLRLVGFVDAAKVSGWRSITEDWSA